MEGKYLSDLIASVVEYCKVNWCEANGATVKSVLHTTTVKKKTTVCQVNLKVDLGLT